MTQITRSNGTVYTTKDDNNRYFMPKEWTDFLEVLKPKQRHTAICQINTGARINEIRHLKEYDVNYINHFLVLRITKTKAKKGESKPKPRTIPISSQFSKYLKKWFRHNEDIKLLSTPAMCQAIKKAAANIGLRNPHEFSTHNIRKTAEMYMLALGVDGFKVCSHLGHNPSTAISHYVSPDIFTIEDRLRIRDIMGDLYSKNEIRV